MAAVCRRRCGSEPARDMTAPPSPIQRRPVRGRIALASHVRQADLPWRCSPITWPAGHPAASTTNTGWSIGSEAVGTLKAPADAATTTTQVARRGLKPLRHSRIGGQSPSPSATTAPSATTVSSATTAPWGFRGLGPLSRYRGRPPVRAVRGQGPPPPVEVPGIEPGSFVASSGLLRAQLAMPLLGPPDHASKSG